MAEANLWRQLSAAREVTASLRRPGGSIYKIVRSGPSPVLALRQSGGDPLDAAQLLDCNRCALEHFAPFSAGWNSYMAGNGWVYDALKLPDNEREAFEKRYRVEDALAATQSAMSGDMAGLLTAARLGSLTSAVAKGTTADPAANPALYVLAQVHGIRSELGSALVTASQIAPVWAALLVLFMSLICWLIFAVALVEPQSPAFENESVGGVGPVHYVVLPLFAAIFTLAGGWMLKERPARLRRLREQLAAARSAFDA